MENGGPLKQAMPSEATRETRPKNDPENPMRIIAGRHKGRTISAPPGRGVRPTPDRVREAVFNILEHGAAGKAAGVAGLRVLDAFCGTGALGLEALSRGAAHATFVDDSPEAVAACRRNVRELGERDRATVFRTDCLNPLRSPGAVDVAFSDPPYRGNLAAPSLAALAASGWIAPGTLCVVQTSAAETFAAPDGFATLEDRRYGATRVRFLEREGRADPVEAGG